MNTNWSNNNNIIIIIIAEITIILRGLATSNEGDAFGL